MATKKLAEILKRRKIKAEEIDHLLPHLSSMFFTERIAKDLEACQIDIPREKWFINLPRIGNIGSASIFLALEELMQSGKLSKGEKILLAVPESARFSYSYAYLTVV